MTDQALLIVGSILTVALGINAYFLRGIHERLSTMQTELAVTIANLINSEKRIAELEKHMSRVREKIHELEGASKSALQFIREHV